jgi:hypothetical protein
MLEAPPGDVSSLDESISGPRQRIQQCMMGGGAWDDRILPAFVYESSPTSEIISKWLICLVFPLL